ncbi:MAG: hypothetical protein MRJ92_10990 [Nitrospira sp.]|nr:hypothetical protein [Nitrospira sp.]
MVELKGTGTALPGLAIQPHIPNEFPLTLHLAPTIDLRLRAGTNAATQLGIVLRPGDASIKHPLPTGHHTACCRSRSGFDFKPASPTLLLGSPKGTRLELQGASIDLGASFVENELDVQAAQLKGLTLSCNQGGRLLSAQPARRQRTPSHHATRYRMVPPSWRAFWEAKVSMLLPGR